MIRKTFKIISDRGMHLRPASLLAQAMADFESDVRIIANDKKYDCKSIMAITSTGLRYQDEFDLSADGPDEEQAMEKAASLIESGLGDLEK